MDKEIIYLTRFKIDPHGNGGDRRAAQIVNIYNPQIINLFTEDKKIKKTSLIFKILKKIPMALYHRYSKYIARSIGWQLSHYYYGNKIDKEGIKKIKNIKVNEIKKVIIDDPIYFPKAFKYLKDKHIYKIAMVHNIESLVRAQVYPMRQERLFVKEIQNLKDADEVITISREDSLLLNNFGIINTFLPYEPNQYIQNQMMKVKKARKNVKKKIGYLLFGTAANPTTYEGMLEFLQSWSKNKINKNLFVAGFATERIEELNRDLLSERITVLGTLSESELLDLLTKVTAVIVYQKSATGSLTKIPELLIAGVPIIGNCYALRTYYNMPGIIEFGSFHELEKIL